MLRIFKDGKTAINLATRGGYELTQLADDLKGVTIDNGLRSKEWKITRRSSALRFKLFMGIQQNQQNNSSIADNAVTPYYQINSSLT